MATKLPPRVVSPTKRPGASISIPPQPRRPGSATGRKFSSASRSPSPSPSPLPHGSSPQLYSSSPVQPAAPAQVALASSPSASPPPDLEQLTSTFYSLLDSDDSAALNQTLSTIRSTILFHGIPITPHPPSSPSPSLRGRLWQILLGLGPISADKYIALVRRGKCDKYSKIRGDSFRTFPQDSQFTAAVAEEEIVRVLNAFVHQFSVAGVEGRYVFTYCQGMNTICAPMLFSMGELGAYYSFCHFIARLTPLYWLSSHIGVEAGCKLVDRCLQAIDPVLHSHLKQAGLHSYLYAFHCVSSFSASVPPFSELLTLWDFLLAFGPHLNIVIVAAQIIALRVALLNTTNPKAILDYRKWPPLRARVMIAMCMSFLSYIEPELYEDIRWHAEREDVAECITGRKVEIGQRE